MFLPALL